MGNLLKCFWSEEDGLGTVEMVLLLAALVAIALLFSGAIKSFVRENIDNIMNGAKNDVKDSSGT